MENNGLNHRLETLYYIVLWRWWYDNHCQESKLRGGGCSNSITKDIEQDIFIGIGCVATTHSCAINVLLTSVYNQILSWHYPWDIHINQFSKVDHDCELYIMLSAVGDDGIIPLWRTSLNPLGLWMWRPDNGH